MRSRQRFLHRRRSVTTDGVTEEGSRTGFWTSPRCAVGREAVKRASHTGPRARTKRLSEAGDPTLPRKTPRELRGARTANRHRWVGRTYQGDRENLA